MRSFLFKHQKAINILFPIIITGCIFYSSILGQRISKIQTDYLIDIITLNNSFITLGINSSMQNNELFQKTYGNIREQMERFNQKYFIKEKELKAEETFKLWFDWIPYILIALMIVFNATILKKNDYN